MAGVLCFDMAAIPVSPVVLLEHAGADWPQIPAQAVAENWHLNQTEPKPVIALVPETDAAFTYLFETREGGKGLLQVLDAVEDPPGVKIRYKMIQQDEGAHEE